MYSPLSLETAKFAVTPTRSPSETRKQTFSRRDSSIIDSANLARNPHLISALSIKLHEISEKRLVPPFLFLFIAGLLNRWDIVMHKLSFDRKESCVSMRVGSLTRENYARIWHDCAIVIVTVININLYMSEIIDYTYSHKCVCVRKRNIKRDV